MEKVISSLRNKYNIPGYLFFYVHLVTEVLCFYSLSNIIANNYLLWIIPFVYDAFAFVPQSLIGYLSDKYPKINLGIIGIVLLVIGFILYNFHIINIFVSLIILCLGNACIHVMGAEITLKGSTGKLSPSAIFVSGGSLGVITGKLLPKSTLMVIILSLVALSTIPFVLLSQIYAKETNYDCKNFNYHNSKVNPHLIVFLAVLVVIVRGYMGYGIPTSWNKSVFETIMLYVSMCIGKALGGILTDNYGIKKVAIISVVGSIPFLILGDNYMLISLIGVTMFSMTMAITLGLLVSVLKDNPGLAFGLTTIGLFLGTVPIFFIKITSFYLNTLVIIISTIICLVILLKIVKENNNG